MVRSVVSSSGWLANYLDAEFFYRGILTFGLLGFIRG